MKVTINYHDKEKSSRDEVAAIAAAQGLQVETVNDFWQTIKVPHAEAGQALIGRMADIPNVQIQTQD